MVPLCSGEQHRSSSLLWIAPLWHPATSMCRSSGVQAGVEDLAMSGRWGSRGTWFIRLPLLVFGVLLYVWRYSSSMFLPSFQRFHFFRISDCTWGRGWRGKGKGEVDRCVFQGCSDIDTTAQNAGIWISCYTIQYHIVYLLETGRCYVWAASCPAVCNRFVPAQAAKTQKQKESRYQELCFRPADQETHFFVDKAVQDGHQETLWRQQHWVSTRDQHDRDRYKINDTLFWKSTGGLSPWCYNVRCSWGRWRINTE